MISELFVIYIQHTLIHPIYIQAHPTLLPPTSGCTRLAVRWWRGQGHEVLFLIFQAAASTGLRFRVRMFRMHGPQWNNTRIILTDARYPVIDAFYLVRTGGN